MTFEQLNLDTELIQALYTLGYEKPLPVQEKVIPILLEQKDCIVKSRTGSGKTASFAIPIIQNLKIDERSPQALVLTPTRELALQIQQDFDHIGTFKKVKTLPIFGKQPFKFQKEDLKQRCHVVIGTPGRVLDHLQQETLDPSKIKYVILDEADEMLNMNFLEEVQAILKYMPFHHTTCLFSATYPEVIQRMSKKYLKKPEKVDLSDTIKPNILQYAYLVEEINKPLFLLHLLAKEKPESCMIFCKTQARVDEVYEILMNHSVSVDKIHGGMMQEERLMHMKRFKKGKVRILVCTDVASRGIDVFKVDLIINYDMPSPVETYTHRIGRSGRVKQRGIAISFVNEYDSVRLEKLEAYLGENLSFHDVSEAWNSDLDALESLKESTRVVIDKSKDLRKDITKIYINGGKNKKIRPGDIVGAICEIEGVNADDIGVIQVQDHQSYVDILNNKGKIVLKNLKNIKGKTLRIQKAKNGFSQ